MDSRCYPSTTGSSMSLLNWSLPACEASMRCIWQPQYPSGMGLAPFSPMTIASYAPLKKMG